MNTCGATSTVVAEFWGVYMVYFVETCGATSTVVAEVWGAYLTYIVDTFGATSIVVALVYFNSGNAEDAGQRASHSFSSMDDLGIVEVAAAALRTRAATSGTR